MYWEQMIQHATQSDLGLRRKNNEDSSTVHICTDYEEWLRRGHLFMVADGMGGHAVGELASQIAIETVPHAFLKSQEGDARVALKKAVELANDAIYQRGTQNPDFLHMGTTSSVLALTPKGAFIAHVGDSRVYRVRRDRIDQLTFDHSLEWEMEQLHGPGLDLSQHRNVITRSLGPEEVVRVDLEGPYPVMPGDVFVLCSDGLSNPVSDPEIGAIARELSPKQAAQLLVHLANIRGGPDNSTVIVAHVGELPQNVAPPAHPAPEADDRDSLGWGWLGAFWAVSMTLVLGLSIMMFGHPLKGGFTAAGAAVGLIVMLIGVIRRRQAMRKAVEANSDDSQTMLCRPHRTATVTSSKDLLESLLAINSGLERSAREDGWDVDWKQHDADLQAAIEAQKTKRYGRGIRDLARAIDCLMSKLPRGGPPKRSERV